MVKLIEILPQSRPDHVQCQVFQDQTHGKRYLLQIVC
jgi:hypothetical protein